MKIKKEGMMVKNQLVAKHIYVGRTLIKEDISASVRPKWASRFGQNIEISSKKEF